MNDRAQRQRIKKLQNIGWAAILILIVAYHFGRPSLEKWTGLSLPAFNGQAADPVAEAPSSRPMGEPDSNRPPPDRDSTASSDSAFELKKIGRDNLMSPAGLIYGMGPRGEHRVEHVMRHARDDPSRPSHGVFVGQKEEILMLLDEAYRLIKEKSARVQTTRERDRTSNVVDMRRQTGYEGGQKGRRNDNRELRKVMLILQDGNRVITAYPYR